MTKSSSSAQATSMPYARSSGEVAGAPSPHPGGDAQGALPLDLFAARRSSRLTPAMKRRLIYPTENTFGGDPGIPRAPHASMLTALRHSGRSFTAHVAESARITKGRCPLTQRGALCPSTQNVYNKMRRVLQAAPATLGAISYKSKGCGDDIPAGVQGRRPCKIIKPPANILRA